MNKSISTIGLLITLILGANLQVVHGAPSADTTVYYNEGKKRVHVYDCKRLPKDPASLATYTKMTLAEAEAKGLTPCSKCPVGAPSN